MTRIALMLGLCAALPAVTFAAGKPTNGSHLPSGSTAPLSQSDADALIARTPTLPSGSASPALSQDDSWERIPPEVFDFNQSDGTYDKAFRVFQRSDGGYWVAGGHRPT